MISFEMASNESLFSFTLAEIPIILLHFDFWLYNKNRKSEVVTTMFVNWRSKWLM